MEKYRIKLKEGKIVGPLKVTQIGQLYAKGLISGKEQCQVFPNGEWKVLPQFGELSLIIKKILEGEIGIEELQRLEQESVAKVENTSSHTEKVVTEHDQGPSEVKHIPHSEFREFDYKNPSPENIDLDKTIIKSAPGQQNFEKTVINPNLINVPYKKEPEDTVTKSLIEDPLNNDPLPVKEQVSAEASVLEPELDQDAKTQFFNIKEETNKAEGESEATVLVKLEESKLQATHIDSKKEKSEEPSKANIEEKHIPQWKEYLFYKKVLGVKPIILLVIPVAFYLLFFSDGGQKEIRIVRPEFSFPVVNEVEDKKQSHENYQRGLSRYALNTYLDTVAASKYFRNSLEFKFEGNEALGNLILAYSEMIDDSTDKIEAGKVIYKLIKIAQTKILKDINVVMGVAKFYSQLEKHYAAIKVIENYLRVGKPSVKLLTVYLEVLVKAGELTKARGVYEKLITVPRKTVDVYRSMGLFLLNDENYPEAKKIFSEAIKTYDKSVGLLVDFCQVLIHDGDLKNLELTLQKIRNLGAESSRSYYVKYLEYLGIHRALTNRPEDAAIYLKKALSINESEELRSQLASLEVGGKEKSKALIIESKTVDRINKAKKAKKSGELEIAFTNALEAVDLSPNYAPARILLAELQMSQGFFEEAIKTLTELVSKNSNSHAANFALVDAYINSYKFDEAEKQLRTMADLNLMDSYQYASAFGKLFLKQGKRLEAIQWFQKSLKRNPLNGDDYFRLANIFLYLRKYARGKNLLLEAISLDPTNIEYRIKYASILYELENTGTAIGYLREVLAEYPDNPKILGEIAIYYYKSGQTKAFEDYKNKLEALPKRDKSLFVFLLRKAQLDDNPDKAIEYSREIAKIDPGDIENKINLGNMYIEKSLFKEAEEVFDDIGNRISTFPRLLYFKSKIKLLKGELNEALELATKETQANPKLEDGYILLGEIYKKMEKFPEAEENYKMALKINNSSVDALLGLAWISYKKNHIDSALDLYEKASSLAPSNAYIRKQLGYVYRAMGQGSLALEAFKVYLELTPDATDRGQIEAIMEELK